MEEEKGGGGGDKLLKSSLNQLIEAGNSHTREFMSTNFPSAKFPKLQHKKRIFANIRPPPLSHTPAFHSNQQPFLFPSGSLLILIPQKVGGNYY